MPFKSEKQRKWMHANEPEMAKKWEKKEKKMKRVKELIKKMVREELAEMNEVRIPFSSSHIKQLKRAFKDMKGTLPDNNPLVQKIVQLLKGQDKKTLQQLANADIKYLSDKAKDILGEEKLTEKSAISLNLWIKEFERLAKKNRMKPVDFVKKHISKRKGMDNEVVKNVLKHFQKNEGKLTEAKEPLWTKETVKDAIKQIKKGLKNAVPYLDGIGTGFGGESIIGKISLDDKKTWTNNILENSRWALIHFHPDGTLDTIRMHGWGDFKTRKKVPM